MPRISSDVAVRPFLKWVGGKGQLLAPITARITALGGFHRYHEPFLGGGALFFHLHATNMLPKRQSFLSDTNPNLIDAYWGVRNHVDDLIQLLSEHKARHSHDYYYEVRASVPEARIERAARIIYLNRTCFNGLYRENSRGEFNVPMGRYTNPAICDVTNLRAASNALQKARIEIRPFATVADRAKAGDFVYFDPPYWPVSPTSSFTAYARYDFNRVDQQALAALFDTLKGRGVRAMLSNSFTPFIRNLYKEHQFDKLDAKRHVNRNAQGRGSVPEILVRNFEL